MMSFESGGGLEDPLEDDDDEEREVETNTESQQQSHTNGSENSVSEDVQSTSKQPEASVPDFSDLDVNREYSTEMIAEVLMDREYHDEAPDVPYAMWRSGTSTGRKRTSLELNPHVDDLLKTAMREFEDRYDCEVNKSDLREMALVWGLLNLDEGVFEIAEEWGLQYNG